MTANETPQAVVIAGPNGAGKTSAAPDLLRDAVGIDAFVNADVIAQGLAAFSPESAAFMVRKLDEDGYAIHIFYLWLPSPDLAVARVRRRVEAGGHDVPEAVIRRRFWKSLVNFDRLFRPVATTWRLYDGSVLGGPPLIAHGTGEDAPVVLDEAKWREIRKRIEEVR